MRHILESHGGGAHGNIDQTSDPDVAKKMSKRVPPTWNRKQPLEVWPTTWVDEVPAFVINESSSLDNDV